MTIIEKARLAANQQVIIYMIIWVLLMRDCSVITLHQERMTIRVAGPTFIIRIVD